MPKPTHRSQEPLEAGVACSCASGGRSLPLVLLFCLSVIALCREFVGTSSFLSGPNQSRTIVVTDLTLRSKGPYQYRSCQLSEISHLPENITRFQTGNVSSWTCRQEISDSYFLVFVDFSIKECPPNYSASTFQLEGSTPRSRIMGTISDRYIFKEGCGIYNASVAIMDHPLDVGQSHTTVNVELFWTSEFKKYSNHLKDIQDAHLIKTEALETEQIQTMFTQERLDYLQRHLDPIFQRQIQITLNQPQKHYAPTPLPDCGAIPIRQWEPAGVFDDPSYNDTSKWAPPLETHQWPFRSARCHFPARTLEEMNQLLAGIRIFGLGDSHMEMLQHEIRAITCPELADDWGPTFFQKKYDCPFRNNSFAFTFRFFRGIFSQNMKGDMDGISKNFRQGSETSCQKILGLGLYNVTLMFTPHWLFVYETQEGLDDYILAIKSLVINCRQAHPELLKDHIILLQSPTARDYLPFSEGNPLDLHPAHSWRGIHNHRLDTFSQKIKRELQDYVDGIIPTFQMTLPRMKTMRTNDGVHLPRSAYRELLHIHIAATKSAMKFKRGLDLPLMKWDDPKARWFADQLFEYPPMR